MTKLRPVDLGRAHGLAPQTVRNYEAAGILPPAERSDAGYRRYTARHAAALAAFVALTAAVGHGAAGTIMVALNEGDLDAALGLIDDAHAQLARDRDTVATVRAALGALPGGTDPTYGRQRTTSRIHPAGPLTTGELAHRLGVTAATLRHWEAAGVLRPPRDPTGQRHFAPDDVRDAELAHLLRRGHFPLPHIAEVLAEVRRAGDPAALARSVTAWDARLRDRGLALLRAAAAVDTYLTVGGGH